LGYEGIIDEAGAAYTWLIEYHRFDPKHIFLCGDSAGANIALSLPWKYACESSMMYFSLSPDRVIVFLY
jgi:dienelactone hydrolase